MTKHIPKGFGSVTPYLTVKGADTLMLFVKHAFDAEEIECHREGDQIVHAIVRIGTSVVELSEATQKWPATLAALHLYVPDCDATHAKALAAGATGLHAPMDQDYGERSSAVRDPAGNHWYIATHQPARS